MNDEVKRIKIKYIRVLLLMEVYLLKTHLDSSNLQLYTSTSTGHDRESVRIHEYDIEFLLAHGSGVWVIAFVENNK